jgi:hypothetical protein
MLVIPSKNHPVRELIDLSHLAEVADPKNIDKLMTKNEIIQKYISKDSPIIGSIESVNVYGLNYSGQLELYRVSRFDIITLWNFITGEGYQDV